MTAILLAGGAVAVMSTPSYAQDYEYPPPPPDPYASPWVGPDTPWVYYNGDWFLNGILYYFYGPAYGWAPYYAYDPSYIVRPGAWYAPMWMAWYTGHPQYWVSFQRQYPYWREHRQGKHYSQKFFEQHHGGQGGGWQKGFKGGPAAGTVPKNANQVLVKWPHMKSSSLLCSTELNHNSSSTSSRSLNHSNNCKSRNNRNIRNLKVRVRNKKNRKVTNNSEVWNPLAPATGEKITLAGFGTFGAEARYQREGRNPRTGETIRISASKVVKFKAGKTLSEKVKQQNLISSHSIR